MSARAWGCCQGACCIAVQVHLALQASYAFPIPGRLSHASTGAVATTFMHQVIQPCIVAPAQCSPKTFSKVLTQQQWQSLEQSVDEVNAIFASKALLADWRNDTHPEDGMTYLPNAFDCVFLARVTRHRPHHCSIAALPEHPS